MTSAPVRRNASWNEESLSDWGFSRRMPRALASSATALAARCSPRPAGRSGCVRTSGTSWPDARMASRARAAKGGVPAKMTRKEACLNSGGLALAFLELRPNAVLFQLGQIVDEDLALEVIHFVLDTGGKHAGRV